MLGALVTFAAAVAWPAALVEASQSITPFESRFTTNDTGNIVLTGNTVMTCPTTESTCAAARNGTATGTANNNNGHAMIYVDVDGDATTFNSSRAVLSLPAGATVLFAGLYWGADTNAGNTVGGVPGVAAPNASLNTQVSFDTPAAGGYTTITGEVLGASGSDYHAFFNATDLVLAAGPGTYTVANVQAGTGGDRQGGWALVVAYRAPGETPRNLTIFDGFAIVNNTAPTTISIPVSGFQTPPAPAEVNTTLGVVAYEGDAGSTGDSFQLNSTNQSNGVNPATNFFNSTISNLGAPAGGGAPSFVNQLGFDIDLITVVPDLANDATSATIGLTTGGETYFPGVVTFATDLFAPDIQVVKSVTDEAGNPIPPGAVVDPGDTLTYSVTVTNSGGDAATNVVLNDPIPANAAYAPNSLTIDGMTRTDAAGDDQANFDAAADAAVFRLGTGASATAGGTLAVGATATITFDVTVDSAPNQPITNQATASFTAQTAGTNLSSASNPVTVTISPPSADLSITKDNGTINVVPGQTLTYTITVTNAGPSSVTGATVTDTFNELINVSWTCSAPGGACGAASGTGNINTTVDLPPNRSATFTVTATVDPATNGDNMIANTATVAPPPNFPPDSDPNPGNETATDTDTVVPPSADLAITKSSSPDPYVAGQTLTYTVTVTNNGPSPVTNATVTDTLPAPFQSFTWTCAATAPNVCDTTAGTGNINATVDLASGGNATFEITGTVPPATTGPVSNTASVDPPSGTTDPTPGNNDDTDVNPTGIITADLSVTKTSSAPTVMPGQPLTYTVTVSNAGPSNVTDAQVTDTVPAALTGATWTCTATAPNVCDTASGSGNINATVDLVSGGTATFEITGTVLSSATGTISNTALVTPPSGANDPDGDNNESTTVVPVQVPSADLAVTKTSAPSPYMPGQTLTYTVTVTNNGPAAVTGAAVTDTIPAAVTDVSWTCMATNGSCGAPSGTGNMIATTVNLQNGGSATFTITGTAPLPPVQTLTNTATVAPPPGTNDPTPGNNSSTDTNPPGPVQADLSVTKTSTPNPYVPGQMLTYTVTVTNNGPSDVTGAAVADTVPAAITGVTWTCTPSTGSTCAAANGSGNTIATTVNLLNGGTATFAITGTAPAGPVQTLTNMATVTAPAGTTDPTPGNNSATDTNPTAATADLAVTKTSNPATAVPGQPLTYIVTVSNAGPSDVTGAQVTDTVPAGLTSVTWTCAATAPNACGTPSGSGNNVATAVNLISGGSATITIMGTVAPTATGTLSNSATVTPPSGTTDPTPGNNTGTSNTPVQPNADLSVTKASTPDPYVPGSTLTYTVVVTNNGPSNVTNAAVTDTLPAALQSFTWTCAATSGSGSSCGMASGTGNINTTVNLVSGGSATFTIMGTVPANQTGGLTNTATVAPPPGTTDPTPGNNTAINENPTGGAQADLSITKTSAPDPYVPGQSLTYTIVVTNNGPSNVTNATVTDPLPAALQSPMWTCAATAPNVCDAPTGSGNINTTVDLVSGGSATFMITGTVPSGTTGAITNTATVAPPQGTTDPTPGNNSATNTNPTGGATADLSVTKSSSPDPYVPGQTLTYTVVARNNGPSNVTGARVTDTLPAALQSPMWTCTAAAANVCGAPSGSGNIDTTVNLVSGATATFTITGTVPPGTTGAISNTVTVAPPAGVNDPTPGNNTATNTNPTGAVMADLEIEKTSSPDPYVPGATLTYTVVVTNNGPSNVTGATVTDTLPAPFQTFTWQCTATAPNACGTPSGTGNINATVNLVVGGTATFTVSGTVPSGTTGAISNTVTVAPPPGATDPTPGNSSDTNQNPTGGARADLQITKTSSPNPFEPGQPLTYTIVVTNAGPSDVAGAAVTDDVPATLGGAGWTCTAAGGGACRQPSGSGDVNLLVDLPAGASATITVGGTVPPGTDSLTNTARVQPPAGVTDPDPSNNSATDTNPPAPPPPAAPGPSPSPSPSPSPGAPSPGTGQPPPVALPTPPPALPIAEPTGPTVAPGRGCVEGPSLSLHGEARTEFALNRTGTMFISPGQLGRDCRSTLDMALDLSIEPLTAGERGRATLTLTNVGATEYGGPLTTVVALPAGVRFSGDVEGDGWGCAEEDAIVLCTRQDPRDPARAALPAIKPGDRTRVSLRLDVERGTPAAVTLWARLVTPGDAVPDNELDRERQSVAGASGPATEPAPAEPWRSLLDPAARLPVILLWLPRELPFRVAGEGWNCDEVDNTMACVPRSVATPELPILRVDTDITARTPQTVNVVSGISVPGAAGPSGTLTTFCIPLIDQTAAGGSPATCTVSSSP